MLRQQAKRPGICDPPGIIITRKLDANLLFRVDRARREDRQQRLGERTSGVDIEATVRIILRVEKIASRDPIQAVRMEQVEPGLLECPRLRCYR
jgi:hypothetical protein